MFTSTPMGETVEVEFVTAEGKAVAVLTLTPADIRTMADREIMHVQNTHPLLVASSPADLSLNSGMNWKTLTH